MITNYQISCFLVIAKDFLFVVSKTLILQGIERYSVILGGTDWNDLV